jgi:AcrR family transcriptional regulator
MFFSTLEVMTKTRRTRTPSTGMEMALLNSATEILEKEGPDALSVRRIAADANVAPMGVYNHFSSKSGIIEALFVQGFDELRTAMASIAEIRDPAAALLESCRRYRALALAHPMTYRLMFLRAVPGFEPTIGALESCAGAFDSLVSAVQRAMDAGAVAQGSAAETAHVLWASVHGWVSLELMGIGFVEDQDASFEHLCRVLLLGIRP